MLEQLLLAGNPDYISDNSDLPFPAGTPFKGVVRAKNFITGSQLATQIDLTVGVPINSDAGWLHFVEDNGYNIYIAKKPLRAGLTWATINTAQTGKEIIIGDKTFLVEFMTGMRADNVAATPANSGGAWDRYIYNVYGGERADQLPSSRENWGSYTEAMLGIPLVSETQSIQTFPPGSMSYMKDVVTNTANGHAVRGVCYPITDSIPNVMGVWYGGTSNSDIYYGWRPMLVEKGTAPPDPVTPFKGEVAQSDFITFSTLATTMGVTTGTAINTTAPWLKIVQNGVTYYWPKASIRRGVLRETLNTLNLVTGNSTIVIGGLTYKVRLVLGRDADTSTTIGREWLDWMTNLTNGNWAAYTPANLVTGTGGTTNGELVLTQERHQATNWAANGYPNLLTSGWYQTANTTNNGYGWRPVLELVP